EHFRAKELPANERLGDRLVLDGLEYERTVRTIKRSNVLRFRFPEQEHSLRRTPSPHDPDTDKVVDVVELGTAHVDIKRGKTSTEPHPRALIVGKPINTDAQQQRLLEIAQCVARRGWEAAKGEFPGARALLLRLPPALGQTGGAPLLAPGEDTVAGVVRLSLGFEPGVLAVQGPPGSGKTHRAVAAILASIRAGRRVGVTASGHAVIRELLRKCCEAALQEGEPLRAQHIHEPEDTGEPASAERLFAVGNDYPSIRAGLQDGSLQLVGGTSFAWSREEFRSSVDVLVVDEAAQISLANVLAVSAAAPRLMLLGDPAQLEQPQRGVHPPGAGVSALEYLLGDARTMPPELGVFLPETRRLHPSVCAFTSRAFYDGRLEALVGLGQQQLWQPGGTRGDRTERASLDSGADTALLSGSGLRFVPVVHRGNTHRCDEEVERIRELVATLLDGSWEYSNARGSAVLSPRHLLVVAPYNAQVAALRRRLPSEVPVGTVDKFQGQEAPVVIYSMTSSSAADAPRGVEFLYSAHRLNVATSRAQALVILVASPELPRAECRTPSQMRLVNALCTYLECCERGATPSPVSV
ncbi:MAG TPA: DEAD/DEAH box helicase, partial [Polyangiaceae bacterium]|nr:DEAD/DEAH box helicase [Polyangiaceae bacterium]